MWFLNYTPTKSSTSYVVDLLYARGGWSLGQQDVLLAHCSQRWGSRLSRAGRPGTHLLRHLLRKSLQSVEETTWVTVATTPGCVTGCMASWRSCMREFCLDACSNARSCFCLVVCGCVCVCACMRLCVRVCVRVCDCVLRLICDGDMSRLMRESIFQMISPWVW